MMKLADCYASVHFSATCVFSHPGLVSMVNDGNGRHGSQFLVTLGANLDSLDGVHTVFGEVAEGQWFESR